MKHSSAIFIPLLGSGVSAIWKKLSRTLKFAELIVAFTEGKTVDLNAQELATSKFIMFVLLIEGFMLDETNIVVVWFYSRFIGLDLADANGRSLQISSKYSTA